MDDSRRGIDWPLLRRVYTWAIGYALIFVGHSHIGAISKGAAASGKKIIAVPLREQLKKLSRNALLAELGDKVAKAVQENAAEVVFCLIGGGMHAVLGLVQHPDRFDFVLPDRADLPFDAHSTLVPFDVMENLMARKLRKHTHLLNQLAQSIPARLVQLEAPPPIKDGTYLLEGGFGYEVAIKTYGISQPWLRYKLWVLQSRLYRRYCERLGITYLPNPREVLDDEGFLARPFWGDFVHANEQYGALLLDKLEKFTHGRPSV
jgi:hypothetical protein